MNKAPEYAIIDKPKTWEPTQELRQVIDGTQGFIGVQRLWRCRETGETRWEFLNTVTAQTAM